MTSTLHIIPLRLTPHSDRTSILTAYSREMGRVGFAVTAGAGPGAARRRALLMPLNPVECVASGRPGRDLLTMREPRALMPLHSIMSSPSRTAQALFIAEVLERLLRQSESEPALFDFIIDAIGRLNDSAIASANFHLTFMVRLGLMLGIAPDVTDYRPGMLFDLLDGQFRLSAPLHGQYLSTADSAAAARLLRINWQNMHAFRMSHTDRNRILDGIIRYYSLHLADLSSLKSLPILRTL